MGTVLSSFTEFYLVLPSFTQFYQVLPSFTQFYRVLANLTSFLPEFCIFLLSFTQFYLVLPSFTQFYLVLPSFTQFYLVFTKFSEILLRMSDRRDGRWRFAIGLFPFHFPPPPRASIKYGHRINQSTTSISKITCSVLDLVAPSIRFLFSFLWFFGPFFLLWLCLGFFFELDGAIQVWLVLIDSNFYLMAIAKSHRCDSLV